MWGAVAPPAMELTMSDSGMDRRDFLKGIAAGAVVLLTADRLLAAEESAEPAFSGPAVKIGVIGLGQWGKDLVSTLSKMPSAQVTAICDNYEAYVKRAVKIAPNAATFDDYRKLLESKGVEAVVIATPTHQHKQIVLEAIQAGKHVYCESPLAASIEDAKAIAQAGKASKQVFQAGQQGRSNLLYTHVEKFVRTGALGKPAQAYAQNNKKQSWRRMAPDPEREKIVNWRLSKETSPGIIGEVGIHQIDLANWYLAGLPTAVTGFGSLINWADGRDVPDTVQCVIEYPNDIRMVFTSTLVSSFSNEYTLFQGSDSSLALRENRGWMIKEADSPLLGWEVYARKEICFDEANAICMIADATKILKDGKEPGKEENIPPTKEAIYLALEGFTKSVRGGGKVACGAVEGYQAAVAALKANEAINANTRVTIDKSLYEV